MILKSRTKVTARPRFRSLRRLLVTLALLAALPLSVRYQPLFAEPAPGPRPDFDYNFTIKDLEGNRVAMETLKGKVIFLNLWATWCGPCRYEMPGIQALYEKMNSDKIAFIMLSIDRDEDHKRVVQYMRAKAFTFKAYMPSGTLTSQLNIPSIPTTFIISPEGKIVKKEVGAQDYNTPQFEKLLAKLAE